MAGAGDFPAGDGEMAARTAAFDWSVTALGARADWSQSLRTTAGILLSSRFPMFLFWGPEAVCLYNDAYRPSLGADLHPETLGRRGQDVWSDIWHIIGPQIAAVMTRGERTWFEDQLVPFDRSGYLEEIYFTYSYSPVFDESGRVGGTLVVCTETTEHVIAQRRTRTLLALAACDGETTDLATEAVREVLSTAGADLAFCALYRLSPRAAELVRCTGVTDDDRLLPRHVVLDADAPGPDPWPRALAGVASAGGRRSVPVESLGRLPGGRWPEPGREVVVSAVAVGHTDVPAYALVTGISPRKSLDGAYDGFLDLVVAGVSATIGRADARAGERRRVDALAELDQARTAFFTGISHELRTPLTLIAGPAQDALDDDTDVLPDPQRTRLMLIRRNTGRLRRLVDTMLDFARLEGGRLVAEPEPVDLAALTRGIAESFAPAARRAGLDFAVDCQPVGGVLVDPDMWEKITLNLLSNAVKFTLRGRIDVALHPGADGTVELVVADTGIGIPVADRLRVFEKFHRVRGGEARNVEGSGIGLALVAELTALHGGSVVVDGVLGAGSRFTVALPAAARTDLSASATRSGSSVGLYLDEALGWSDEPPGPDAQRVETGSTTGATVLLAEDNPDLRAFVAGLLRPHYTVLLARDGRAALDLARHRRVDLVLTDVMMPRLDGFGLLAALRAHPTTAGLPVIMLSARAGEGAVVEGLAAGADDYLSKPFSSHDLLARVRSNLELVRLRNHEATWRAAMLDALQDGFCVIDVDGAAIVEINPAVTELLGLHPHDLTRGPPYPIFPTEEEDAAELATLVSAFAVAVTEDHGTVVVPLRHVETRQRVWVSVSLQRRARPRRPAQALHRDAARRHREPPRRGPRLAAGRGRSVARRTGRADRPAGPVRRAGRPGAGRSRHRVAARPGRPVDGGGRPRRRARPRRWPPQRVPPADPR